MAGALSVVLFIITGILSLVVFKITGNDKRKEMCIRDRTGTASTVMVGCVEGILGMRPDLYGLRIAPSIPKEWEMFEGIRD